MPYLFGAVLALGVGAFATLVGFDQERGFYPTVTIVIASYYWLFAIMDGGAALLPELLISAPFIVLALAGFRRTAWLAVTALIAHGAMDLVHPHLVRNGGSPAWWPTFCAAFDVVAGAYLAFRQSAARPIPTA